MIDVSDSQVATADHGRAFHELVSCGGVVARDGGSQGEGTRGHGAGGKSSGLESVLGGLTEPETVLGEHGTGGHEDEEKGEEGFLHWRRFGV